MRQFKVCAKVDVGKTVKNQRCEQKYSCQGTQPDTNLSPTVLNKIKGGFDNLRLLLGESMYLSIIYIVCPPDATVYSSVRILPS